MTSIDATNVQQDMLIAEGISKNEEQDTHLNDIDKINIQHEELLKQQATLIEELTQQIAALKQEKGIKIVMYITAATATTALILSILHFFL